MIVVFSEKQKEHRPPKELWRGNPRDYTERSERTQAILNEIRGRWEIEEPLARSEEFEDVLYDVHDPLMVKFLVDNQRNRIVRQCEQPEHILECDETVSLSYDPKSCGSTYIAALFSAASAFSGAKLLVGGERAVYALCRPPGHHATRYKMGGYCFFNNAAIAAVKLMEHGKVAVLDIDRHHGNGTQDIFFDNEESEDVIFVSLNCERTYPHHPFALDCERQDPYLNTDRIANFTVRSDVGDEGYLEMVDGALDRIRSCGADVVVVSAGFDTSEKELPWLDVAEAVKLTRNCYHRIGQKLRETGLPVLAVQEGGYSLGSLGKDVRAFLEGLDGK